MKHAAIAGNARGIGFGLAAERSKGVEGQDIVQVFSRARFLKFFLCGKAQRGDGHTTSVPAGMPNNVLTAWLSKAPIQQVPRPSARAARTRWVKAMDTSTNMLMSPM